MLGEGGALVTSFSGVVTSQYLERSSIYRVTIPMSGCPWVIVRQYELTPYSDLVSIHCARGWCASGFGGG